MKLFSILDDHLNYGEGGLQPSAAAKFGMVAGVLPPLAGFAVNASKSSEEMTFSFISLAIGMLVLVCFALVGGSVAVFLSEGKLKHIFYYGVSAPAIVLAAAASGSLNAENSKLEQKIGTSEEKAEEAKEQTEIKATSVKELEYRMKLLEEEKARKARELGWPEEQNDPNEESIG